MTAKAFIKKTWFLNRVTVGSDTEAVARLIEKEYSGRLHRFASGGEHLTWIIPDEWEVEEAVLTDPKGKVLADFAENPLSLASYSKSFSGRVGLRELKKHLFTNEKLPGAIPYHYLWQYQYGKKQNWGFCLPHTVYKNLKPGKYEVRIKTNFKKGYMYINELVLPGKSEETVLLAAHTCHPAQVNDGISCVATLLEVYKWLKKQKKPQYTYKFLFGPEYFTAAAYLSEFGPGQLALGLYLDMPGNGQPLAFSGSFFGENYIDKVTRLVFGEMSGELKEYDYRTLWGNDELFYDGPGFNIPMICLGRDLFDRYHTSQDNLDAFDFKQLTETKNTIINIIKMIETDQRIEKITPGPTYFSRFENKIFDQLDSGLVQQIEILLAEGLSYVEAAYGLGLSFSAVKLVGDALLKNKLAKVI